ncbi:hypothetical protein R8Z50_30190 [Longispora sp. K20-0274]|uniref:hypothetical protein n=1 Tax=Longispora sp. K20-0274 TaxID=3088255 RepID=UPI00399A008A
MAEDNGPSPDSRALFAQLAKMIRADDPQQLHDNADAWLTLSRGLYTRAAQLRADAAELARLWPDSTGTAVTTALAGHIGALEREAGTYQHNYGQVSSAASALAQAQSRLDAIENDPSTVEAKAAEAQKLIVALDGEYQNSHTRIQDPQVSGQIGDDRRTVGEDPSQPEWVSTDTGSGPGRGSTPEAGTGTGSVPPAPVFGGAEDGGPPARPPIEHAPTFPRHDPKDDSGTGLAGGGVGPFGSGTKTTVTSGLGTGGGFGPGSTGVGAGAAPATSATTGLGGLTGGPGQPAATSGSGAGRLGAGGPGLPGGPGSGTGPHGARGRRRDSRAVGDWLAVDNDAAPAVLGGRRRASDDASPEAHRWEHEERILDDTSGDAGFDLLGIGVSAGPEPYDDRLEYLDDEPNDTPMDETGRDWRDGLNDEELAAWSNLTGVRLAGPARD